MSSKSTKQETSSTQQEQESSTYKTPLGGTAGDAFDKLWSTASGALDKTNNVSYTGDYVAQPTGATTTAANMLTSNAGDMGVGASNLRNLALDTINGKYLPNTTDYVANPQLQNVIQSALDPINKSLMESVLPSVKSQAISQGAYGGARQDLQENSAIQDWTRQGAATASNISYQDYNDWMNRQASAYAQERANQMGAGSLLTGANTLENAPAQQLLTADAINQSAQQAAINNNLQKYQNQLSSPWYGLGDLASILTAGGFNKADNYASGTGAGQSTATTTSSGGIMDFLKGGLGLASGIASLV